MIHKKLYIENAPLKLLDKLREEVSWSMIEHSIAVYLVDLVELVFAFIITEVWTSFKHRILIITSFLSVESYSGWIVIHTHFFQN